MRRVEFDPTNLTGDQRVRWDTWQSRASAATDKVIAEWEKWLEGWLEERDPKARFTFTFNSKVWTELKEWMKQNLFHNRCAYCEAPLTRFFADAEHHRPKGRVSEANQEGVSIAKRAILEVGAEQIEIEHPGYFWLAYNWRNLIPSCEWCNQGGSKVDQYPIDKIHVVMRRIEAADAAALQHSIRSTKWPSSYYLGPSNLDLHECPLLLNPLNPEAAREPLKHLRFGVRGEIVALSRIGARTIQILRLDDGELTMRREKAQRNIYRAYFGKYLDPDHTDEDLDEVLRPFRRGEEDYSVSALEYIAINLSRMSRRARSVSPKSATSASARRGRAAPATLDVSTITPDFGSHHG